MPTLLFFRCETRNIRTLVIQRNHGKGCISCVVEKWDCAVTTNTYLCVSSYGAGSNIKVGPSKVPIHSAEALVLSRSLEEIIIISLIFVACWAKIMVNESTGDPDTKK